MALFERDVDFRRRPRGGTTATTRLEDMLPGARARSSGKAKVELSPATVGSFDPEPAIDVGEPSADTCEPQAEAIAPEPVSSPAPPEPQADEFDAAAVPAMLEAAVAEAREQTLREAMAQIEAAQTQALAAIETGLRADVTARQGRQAQEGARILAVAAAIARRVVPRALAASPLDDLAAALPDLLSRLDHPPELEVAVAAALQPPLEATMTQLAAAAGFDGTIRVVADAALGAGEARVRWPGGEARHDPDAMIRQAEALCAGWLAECEAKGADARATTPAAEEPRDDH